ncbi:CopG family transcriptional regulator [Sphingomonas sp. DBB INV C78]|uniref:CopG family transcriptional regulator n=1 Tax=Sphingomonas sp. DBB INV C78 TaxID=3349434 RepID=UPI0036D25C34
MKVRQNLYIDRELSEALEALALKPGGNKSRIVNEAIRVWLARRATKELDDLLKVRLDRLSRDISACRRDVEVVLEALALFVRHQLTVTALLPEGDSAARAVGNERFERFIVQLGRKIAVGERTLDKTGVGAPG